MSILNNYKRNITSLFINKSEYYDYCINRGEINANKINNGSNIDTECLICKIDFSKNNFEDSEKKWIYSERDYVYGNSIAIDNTLNNIGYTSIDNGMLSFKKDRISNADFFDLYTKSQYKIEENEYRLKLHTITGSTEQFSYPIEYNNDFITLKGGFLQGFFETEKNKYKILPDDICDGSEWNIQFSLRTNNTLETNDNILNKEYPDNKGIFFYLGTRAEDKWTILYNEIPDSGITNSYLANSGYSESNEYYKDEIIDEYSHLDTYFLDDLPSPCQVNDGECNIMEQYWGDFMNKSEYSNNNEHNTMKEYWGEFMNKSEYCNNLKYFEDENNGYEGNDIDLRKYNYTTKLNFNLDKTGYYEFSTNNGFLIYDRSKDGYTVDTWKQGDILTMYDIDKKYKGNLFLYMNRGKSGSTVDNADELLVNNETDYNMYDDLFMNAFALQIKEDGSIGYKYLIKNCDNENNIDIVSGFSKKDIIKNNTWYSINVKIKCYGNLIKILFYVDGKLKFISKELPKFNFRKLNEVYEKQEGVPFNISIGGGTQGLCDVIMPKYLKIYDTLNYPLCKNFGGSFIGDIKSFRFYNCTRVLGTLRNNYLYDEKINK